MRKMIKLAKPKAVFSIQDKEYSYKSVSTVRTMETKCRLGEEFIETIPDGNKTTVSFEEPKLVRRTMNDVIRSSMGLISRWLYN